MTTCRLLNQEELLEEEEIHEEAWDHWKRSLARFKLCGNMESDLANHHLTWADLLSVSEAWPLDDLEDFLKGHGHGQLKLQDLAEGRRGIPELVVRHAKALLLRPKVIHYLHMHRIHWDDFMQILHDLDSGVLEKWSGLSLDAVETELEKMREDGTKLEHKLAVARFLRGTHEPTVTLRPVITVVK